jgi:hypothetical protein
MLVTIFDNRVYVRLSRRNLRQLQAMLDSPAETTRWLARTDENGVSVVVQVENDADHYTGTRSGPTTRVEPSGPLA